ncbi:hypothetical protein NMY22_g7220 [Coprinellus aureogranulatus]|nr:hypothetical protein NMY22_g7220 [Coprinellus aureogranulatus]
MVIEHLTRDRHIINPSARRNRRHHCQRERASIARLSWSPVTTLNSTPFASHNNSPMRACPWEKAGYSGSFGSRVGSFYTATSDTAPNSPCTFLRSKSALNLQLHPGDENEVDGDGCEGKIGQGKPAIMISDDMEDRRSISPLDLSPHLARLPSVKSGSTNRISDLVRGSMLLGGTTWEDQRRRGRESMMSGITLNESVQNSPPKINARLSVIDRRSALFSSSEIHSLFEGRNSGILVPESANLKASH